MKRSIVFGIVVLVLAALAAVSAFWCFGVAIPQYSVAEESGTLSGETVGKLVGVGIGTYYGVTDGLVAGSEDGKEDGISAKTTTSVDIQSSFSEVGKLEVMSASVSIRNLHQAGGGDYASLEVLFGKGIFTVDLSEAEITESSDGSITIKIPNPRMELYIDEEKTAHLGEYQKFPWVGNAEEGYDAYINSRIVVDEKVQDKIAHYDLLLQQARESAKTQVELLAESVSVDGKSVTVMLPGKAGA